DGTATVSANSSLHLRTRRSRPTRRSSDLQTVTATDTATSSIAGTSNSVVVVAAAADHLTVTAPTPQTAGVSFGSVVVTAKDTFGNAENAYDRTFRVTFTYGTPPLPAKSTL